MSINDPYKIYHAAWRGIELEIRWSAKWWDSDPDLNITAYGHLEFETLNPAKAALPITDTGYTSRYPRPEAVEKMGGPVAFALALLDHEASKSSAWREQNLQSQQMTLF